MKITLRKVGNSLGVIIPKAALDSWGLREGDTLQLSERGLAPASSGTSHESLDELKRRLAFAVASSFTPRQIRAQGLANLHRWRKAGVWASAYDEWTRILEGTDDGELFAAMLGRDDHSNRLRQSPPYVGLLAREEVKKLNEGTTRDDWLLRGSGGGTDTKTAEEMERTARKSPRKGRGRRSGPVPRSA